jgi:hypothetical protein
MNMNNKEWWEVLPQGFGACVPGIWVAFFGGLVKDSPVLLVFGLLLIVIPAVLVIVRRVAGG